MKTYWAIAHRFMYGFSVPNSETLFETKAEADEELKCHLSYMQCAVEEGFLEDYDKDDWKVVATNQSGVILDNKDIIA